MQSNSDADLIYERSRFEVIEFSGGRVRFRKPDADTAKKWKTRVMQKQDAMDKLDDQAVVAGVPMDAVNYAVTEMAKYWQGKITVDGERLPVTAELLLDGLFDPDELWMMFCMLIGALGKGVGDLDRGKSEPQSNASPTIQGGTTAEPATIKAKSLETAPTSSSVPTNSQSTSATLVERSTA
jgi:hypothetical protein